MPCIWQGLESEAGRVLCLDRDTRRASDRRQTYVLQGEDFVQLRGAAHGNGQVFKCTASEEAQVGTYGHSFQD